MRDEWLDLTQNDISQNLRKFRLQAPVLRNNLQNYEVSCYEHCKNWLHFLSKEAERCCSETKKSLNKNSEKTRYLIKWKKKIQNKNILVAGGESK